MLQNDIESKRKNYPANSLLRLSAASTPGAVRSSSGNAALSSFENEITAKSSWDAGTQQQRQAPVSSSSGNAALSSFENEITAKSSGDAGTQQQRQAPATSTSALMADGGLHSLEAEIRRKSSPTTALPPFMSRPHHPDQEVAHDNHITGPPQPSLPQHFMPHHQHNFDDPMLYRHPPDPRLDFDDSVAPSMGGDGFDSSGPPPLTIPYNVSDEQAQSNLHHHHPSRDDDYNSDDNNTPSVDEPAAEVQAYVPPTVVEAAGVAVVLSTEEEERLMKQKRKKYVCLGAACVCLIAAAIIVPTVLRATSEYGRPIYDIPPSVAPSVAPSFAPSGAPTSSAFAEFLDGVLKPLNVSTENAFDNVDSPQYEAALWLVLEDRETYWPQNGLTADHWSIVQRYSLATFHESTAGEKWKFCGKPPSVCFDVAWLTGTLTVPLLPEEISTTCHLPTLLYDCMRSNR